MDDLISRQAAIDALGEDPKYKVRIFKTYKEGRSDQWFDDVAKILAVPSAQTERKKGEWIGKPLGGYCTVRCSVCGEAFSENNGRWNFCPHCGADMRGEQDGN